MAKDVTSPSERILVELLKAKIALSNVYDVVNETTRMTSSDSYLIGGLKSTQLCLEANIDTVKAIKKHTEVTPDGAKSKNVSED